jgi:phage terminase large subunit
MPSISIPYDFVPRWYQLPLWRYMQKGGFQKKRAVCVWHRRGGKDLNSINLIATAMMERPGLYWHLFPTYAQGKKIAWDGKTKAQRPFLDAFPKDLVGSKNHTEMKLVLKTGAIYQVVGADKPDSLVGPNPVGIILSEWSLMSPKIWEFLMPILAENDGWAIFIFTPRGKNHGFKMLNLAKVNPNWFHSVLPNSITKVVPKEAVDEMRNSGMSEEMIMQEMEVSFDAPIQGSYYGRLINLAEKEGRICRVPWEPKLPVNTAWDIGVGDSTSIWFYQQYGMEIRVIDYYENSGEGLPHYVKILKERDYVFGRHYAPHDIEVREFTSGRSRWDIARGLGIKFEVGSMLPVDEGIENVRGLLGRCWFDAVKCEHGIEALKQYHKEWDDDKQCFRDKPEHDWASHPADAFRELAMSLKNRPKFEKKPQQQAVSDYDMLSV